MKEFLKRVLKLIGLYHPLQGFYRELILKRVRAQTRKDYEPFKGGSLTCNVCGASYSKFVPDLPTEEDGLALRQHEVIAGYGKNIICPSCLSTARERLIIAMLGKQDLEGLEVLHIAPEKVIFNFLDTRTKVVSADIMPAQYRTVDRKIKYADLTHLPFADGRFDRVIANHVLEHVPEDEQAMQEIYRVLKKGGQAFLQVPISNRLEGTIEDKQINDPERQTLLFGQRDHVRIYALKDFIKRLEASGFHVRYILYEELQEFYKNAIQEGEGFFEIRK